MMKIGFIGVGHMAQAIIKGFLQAKAVEPQDIFLHSAHLQNHEDFAKKYQLTVCSDNLEVVEKSDMVILAVKPDQKETVFSEINATLQHQNKPLLSLLSGVKLQQLEQLTTTKLPIVRVMPNLNVQIGQGLTALAANEIAQPAILAQVKQLFARVGTALILPETDFQAFATLAGSAPAFVYLMIDALAHAGVKYGLSKDEAVKIVSQMVSGSAQLVQRSDQHPWALIDAVASPGGSTIAGVLALQEAGFEAALTKAVDATIARS